MHIGGAVQGLQHVVYDPAAVAPRPAPTSSSPVTARADVDHHADHGGGGGNGYNPVTDLIERLTAPERPAPPADAPAAFAPSDPPETHIDIQA